MADERKVALVTGSALNIGRAIALALAEDGRVFAWGRNADGKTAIRPVQRLPCATRVACTMNI